MTISKKYNSPYTQVTAIPGKVNTGFKNCQPNWLFYTVDSVAKFPFVNKVVHLALWTALCHSQFPETLRTYYLSEYVPNVLSKMFYLLSEGNSLSANQNMVGELENIHYLREIISTFQSFYPIQGMTLLVSLLLLLH